MREREHGRHWFWATLVLSSISIVALVFAFWELVENHYFRDLNYVSLHYLYISRGIASSLLLASWAAWFVLRQRRMAERELRRSRERYRGLVSRAWVALSRLYQQKSDPEEALKALDRALAFDPLQEDLQREAIRLANSKENVRRVYYQSYHPEGIPPPSRTIYTSFSISPRRPA